MNRTPSERVAVLGRAIPVSATGANNSGRVALANFFRIQAIINVGALAATSTVNAKLQGSVGVGGALEDIPGAAIAPLVGAANGSKIAIIDLNCDSLARLGYTHVQLTLATTVADGATSALLLGFDSRYGPAYAQDNAAVAQIVTV